MNLNTFDTLCDRCPACNQSFAQVNPELTYREEEAERTPDGHLSVQCHSSPPAPHLHATCKRCGFHWLVEVHSIDLVRMFIKGGQHGVD